MLWQVAQAVNTGLSVVKY